MRGISAVATSILVLTATAAGVGPDVTATASATGTTAVDILALLREFGFPIFVSVWFMWRLEKRLDHFTESIEKLYTTVVTMAKTLDGMDK